MERTFVLEPTGGLSSKRMKEREDAKGQGGTVVVVRRGATGRPASLKQVIVDTEQGTAVISSSSRQPAHAEGEVDGMRQKQTQKEKEPSGRSRRQVPSASEWVPRAVHSMVSSMGERKPCPSVRCWETALLPLKTIDDRIEQQSALQREAEQRARRVLRERGGGGGGLRGAAGEAVDGYALGFSVDLEEGLRECDAYEEATEALAKACSSCLDSAREECERLEGTSFEKMGMLRDESERLKRMVDSLPLERSGDAWRERIRELIEEELDRSARRMVQEEREGLLTVREEAESLIGASKAMRTADCWAEEEEEEEEEEDREAGRRSMRRSPLVRTMVRCKKRECDLRAVRHILLASAPCATWVGRAAQAVI